MFITQNGLKQKDASTAFYFPLFFRTCHKEGPRYDRNWMGYISI